MRYFCPISGINSTLLDREGHPVNREHVGRDTVVHRVSLGVAHDVAETFGENGLKLLIHHGFFPEVALPVLHPLEIGCGYSSGIRQNIRNYKYLLIRKTLIGYRRRWAVRSFTYNARLYP